MKERYAKLHGDWLMRGWDNVPFALVHWKTDDVRPFTDRLAYVARACDGCTDFNSLLFLPVHRTILGKLMDEGIAQECRGNDTIHEYQKFRKAPNPCLPKIHWSITGKCNLNCRHCYMEAPGYRYGDMDQDTVNKVMGQFERANILSVSITGGEPLVRSDFFDIAAALLNRGINIHQIYTNGLLADDHILDNIQSIGIRPGFCLSFDGVGGHDHMRGIDGIEGKTVTAIQRIIAAGFKVTITTSLDKTNQHTLSETYALLKAMGIRAWHIAPPAGIGNWTTSETAVTIDEEFNLYKAVLRQWHQDRSPFDLQLGAFFNSKADTIGDHGPEAAPGFTEDAFACGVCRHSLYLLPDGTLLPCHGMTGTAIQDDMPNIKDGELSDIIRESKLMAFVNTRKGDLLKYNPECAACGYFEKCGLGCRALALIHGHGLYSKDPVSCAIHRNHYKERLVDEICRFANYPLKPPQFCSAESR